MFLRRLNRLHSKILHSKFTYGTLIFCVPFKHRRIIGYFLYLFSSDFGTFERWVADPKCKKTYTSMTPRAIIIIIRFIKRQNVKRLPWRIQCIELAALERKCRNFTRFMIDSFISIIQHGVARTLSFQTPLFVVFDGRRQYTYESTPIELEACIQRSPRRRLTRALWIIHEYLVKTRWKRARLRLRCCAYDPQQLYQGQLQLRQLLAHCQHCLAERPSAALPVYRSAVISPSTGRQHVVGKSPLPLPVYVNAN